MSRTTINITGYTVDDNVNSSDDLFSLASGSTLVFLGESALSDDAIDGLGVARARGATTIDDSLLVTGAALFANVNDVTQNGAVLDLGQSPEDAVTARNLAGATWTLLNGAGITSVGASEFVNLGLLHQAAGSGVIDANFVDRGGVIEIDGTLNFASPGDVNRFVDDKIEGAGTFEADDDAVLDGSSVSTLDAVFADVRIVGNVHVSSQSIIVGNVNLAPGAILTLANSTGTAAFQDVFDPNYKIGGAGTIAIRGNYNIAAEAPLNLAGDVTFANYGNILFTGIVDFTATPSAGGAVTIENEAGATWTAGTSIFGSNGAAGTAVFINDGTYISGPGTGFGIAVVNNGVIEPTVPPYPIENAFIGFNSVTGTGTVDIGAYQTFVDTVGSGQTFNFDAALAGDNTPILGITDPQAFAGTIAGFEQGDQIALTTTAWQYQSFAPSAGGGALVLSNGSATTDINLVGTYDPSGFHAAVSGSTTTITYTG
jgi:hypothetical protein